MSRSCPLKIEDPHMWPPHTLTWLGTGDLFVAGFRENNVIEVCLAGTLLRHTLRHRNADGRGVSTVAVLKHEAIGEHVSIIAGAPDGRRIAAATSRGRIQIWDRNGAVQSRLGQHRGEVHAIAWSRDGKCLATVGADGTLRIWDPHNGAVQVRKEHTGAFRVVDWSPDKRVATGHDDQRLVVRAEDGEVLRELTGHRGPVSSVEWAPNGEHLASTSADGISIWHAGSGKQLRLLTVPRGTQRSASWAPDGRRLASVGDDNVIHLWEVWR
jgi:WD40 repeat protein